MIKYHTTSSSGGKVISCEGKLKLLEQTDKWRQKVEVWLLNDAVNRNNWRYENLEEHRKQFAHSPLLVAYVHGKIGDGHNFEEYTAPDGTTTASFLSETAERIVGEFVDENDIRIAEADNKKWIVGTGYIWTWYAQELVAKLKRQGLQGMSVSIETLIDEMHTEGKTEVFTRYQILGTTILGEDVPPAVKDANIKVLAALGVEEVKKITLRVASAAQSQKSTHITSKGESKPQMKLSELRKKFDGFHVVGVDGKNVALLSDRGVPYLTTAEKHENEIITGVRAESTAKIVFTNGELSLEFPAEATIEECISAYVNRCETLEQQLESANNEKETVTKALETMQKAEMARRRSVIREIITKRLADIRQNGDAEIDESACDSLLTDARVEEYACMEDKDGNFIGDAAARRDVDAICMDKIIEASRCRANSQKKRYAWDIDHPDNTAPETGILASIKRLSN